MEHKLSPFARKVYRVVLKIPLGEVRSYKWVARRAGSPYAWRSVGAILKNNHYPLIIPCHRVIKSDQQLGRYSFGGQKRKKFILDLEKRIKLCLRNKG